MEIERPREKGHAMKKYTHYYEGLSLLIYLLLGRAVQLAGSQFPDQGLNPRHSSERLES